MRIVDRLLAFVVSLALIVGGVLLVTEVVAQRIGADPVLVDWPAAYRWARETTWAAPAVRLASVLLIVVGLALLLAQLKPRRPVLLPLDSDTAATDAAVTRRGLARAVHRAVADVDGVSDANVKVRRRRIRVRARTRPLSPGTAESTRDTIRQAVRDRVEAVRLRKTPALTVRVSSKER